MLVGTEQMIRFLRELRRREVFRTVGLYVGVCWLLIEAASILLPAFEAPTWMLRALVLIAVAGFPLVAILAWVYDITESRVVRDAEHAEAAVPALGSRKMDFVVIGVLSVALGFSVYLNITGRPEVLETLEPVSLLIADFENSTGETIFDGLLEQALDIGIESAPHVMSYPRNEAELIAVELQPGGQGLPAEAARLVAVREGVDLVLSGLVAPTDRGGFALELSALDPISGETNFSVSARAASTDDILAAVGTLSENVREALGDPTLTLTDDATTETFTAASIEAASAYTRGIELAFDGEDEAAIEHLRTATGLDPNLGRAYAAWALSEYKLGREAAAAEQWDKALSLLGTMTERERLRTLGVYYARGGGDFEQAMETFAELVEKYPSDAAGRNNLAVAAFVLLDFETAFTEGDRVVEMFPTSALYRANHALYAMYAGNFDAAETAASALIESDPEYGTAYIPLAIARLANDDVPGARDAYARMSRATISPYRESAATHGLADTSLYVGELGPARDLLREGIEQDLGEGADAGAAMKHIALAESFVIAGDYPAATAAAREALDLSSRESIRVAAAIVLVESGELVAAREIASQLDAQLSTSARAYARMIDASIQRQSGEHVTAIQTLRLALDILDLWRIRYELGRTYVEGGFFAEAFDELDTCVQRRGEAVALFLDEVPTYRYLADLNYWLARAQDGLGMADAAAESYAAFLALRPEGGPLAEDARSRTEAR